MSVSQMDRYRAQGSGDVVWVPKSKRMPVEEEADLRGLVLIYDENNGIMLSRWNDPRQIGREPVTHWATPPRLPGDTNGKE